MTEDEIIRLFYVKDFALDDCAHYSLKDSQSFAIITTDSMSNHVHFKLEWFSGADLAHKLFQVNLSDICAQLGKPNWCLLNIGIPQKITPSLKKILKDFAKELRRQCQRHQSPLIGGDTFRCKEFVVSLTMSGLTTRKISRGCKQKDCQIYVSGNLGCSQLGLQLFKKQGKKVASGIEKVCRAKYLRPTARFDIINQLKNKSNIYAIIDISDGLFSEAHHLAKRNQLTLEIELEKVPIHRKLSNSLAPEAAIFSGEELELLILGGTHLEKKYPQILTRIGSTRHCPQKGGGKVIFRKNGTPLKIKPQGFRHFLPA